MRPVPSSCAGRSRKLSHSQEHRSAIIVPASANRRKIAHLDGCWWSFARMRLTFAVTKNVRRSRACRCFDVHATSRALTVFFFADRKFTSIIHYLWTSTHVVIQPWACWFVNWHHHRAWVPWVLPVSGYLEQALASCQLSAAMRLPLEWPLL